MKNPRRDTKFSLDIIKLLMLPVLRSGIGLPGILKSTGAAPRKSVGHFLVRHRLARHISAPARSPQFRTAGDHDRAQALIADQREKGIVRDGAALWSCTAARPMARFAVGFVRYLTSLGIARRFRCIGRRIDSVENSMTAPARPHFARNEVNLFVGQHSSGAFGERWHCRSVHAVRNDFTNRFVIRDGQINWISKRDGGSSPPFRTVTACAAFPLPMPEFHSFIGRQSFGTLRRLAGGGTPTREQHQAQTPAHT